MQLKDLNVIIVRFGLCTLLIFKKFKKLLKKHLELKNVEVKTFVTRSFARLSYIKKMYVDIDENLQININII